MVTVHGFIWFVWHYVSYFAQFYLRDMYDTSITYPRLRSCWKNNRYSLVSLGVGGAELDPVRWFSFSCEINNCMDPSPKRSEGIRDDAVYVVGGKQKLSCVRPAGTCGVWRREVVYFVFCCRSGLLLGVVVAESGV